MPQTMPAPRTTDDRSATGHGTRQCAYCHGQFEPVQPLDRFCRPSCRKGFADSYRAELKTRGALFDSD